MKFKKHPNHQTFLVNTYLVISSIIWGSTFFTQKDALNFLDPFTLNTYRAILGSLVLGIGLWVFKKNPFHNFKIGILTGILYFAALTAQTVGLNYTTAFNSGFIVGLFVLFVPIFSFMFLHTKLGVEKIVAVILSILGLWFATGGVHGCNIGDLLNLVSAVFWGIYVLAADKALKNGSGPYSLNFQQLLITAIFSVFVVGAQHFLPVHGAWAQNVVPLPMHAVYLIVYLAIFANVIAYCLQFLAQKYASPINVAMLLLLEPVFSGIFACTLGGESFTMTKLMGGMIIVFAIALSEVEVQNSVPLSNFKKNFIYMFSKKKS